MLSCQDCIAYPWCEDEEKDCGICEAYEKKEEEDNE